MKRKMKLTITFDEDSEEYGVSIDFDSFDLEIFIEAVASVIVNYGEALAEENISPADVGFMVSLALMEDMFGGEKDEEF